ncbi:hypothetical protein [[Mycobacterium] crassicus]|uniref:Uncharacterized protein n=1 Tax=[Mycobacterium] crassicus TaxID=2872309 RepID=A0ABU5XNY0_9MYCO|nr:hypothetical protein [Mycolicibacter sp. MYC098]MEB3023914.1 hypothetical protein [Mycolicibacter sp. MYC098]
MEALRDIKNKLFDGTGRDVPRTYLELLKIRGAADWTEFVDASDDAMFCAYWLEGGLLRSVAYRGEDQDASAEECAFPLSMLIGLTTSYTFGGQRVGFDYKHFYWQRKVEIRFQGADPIVLRDKAAEAGQPTRVSVFVDAIAAAA